MNIGFENYDGEEIWADTWDPKIPDLYQASTKGRIRNKKTKYILTLENFENRYFRIGATDIRVPYKKSTHVFVHRLCARAFIDNPNNYYFVNHKDGNGFNNNIYNLEWISASDNQKHAYETGLQPRGEDRVNAVFTNDFIEDICVMISEGYRVKDIKGYCTIFYPEYTKKQIGYCVNDIKKGHSWGFIYDKFKKPDFDPLDKLRSLIIHLYKNGLSTTDILIYLTSEYNYYALSINQIRKTIYNYKNSY